MGPRSFGLRTPCPVGKRGAIVVKFFEGPRDVIHFGAFAE